MIQQLKTITPAIDLGFGITQKQVAQGTTVTVWLNTLYNKEAYTFMLLAQGAAVTKISNYQYLLVYNTPGIYLVSLNVNSTDKTISIASNILNITVT